MHSLPLLYSTTYSIGMREKNKILKSVQFNWKPSFDHNNVDHSALQSIFHRKLSLI